MNVPAIRKALKQVVPSRIAPEDIANAVLHVGLRACDVWDQKDNLPWELREMARLRLDLIADILREAGVEVEG